jgi:hypothetical protein
VIGRDRIEVLPETSMVSRADRLQHFIIDADPAFGSAVEVLCEGHVGTSICRSVAMICSVLQFLRLAISGFSDPGRPSQSTRSKTSQSGQEIAHFHRVWPGQAGAGANRAAQSASWRCSEVVAWCILTTNARP